MNILAITDLHGDRQALEQILTSTAVQAIEVDLILLGGDLTHFGTPGDATWFVDAARGVAPAVFAVAGNCDSPEIDRRFAELDADLFARGRTIDGVGLIGLSAMPPWTGSMYELEETQLADALSRGTGELADDRRHTVVLSHTPPYGTSTDRISSGKHVGSTALRSYVDEHQPTLVVSGHIHEARGIDHVGTTTVVNCGPAFNRSFALIEIREAVTAELHSLAGEGS